MATRKPKELKPTPKPEGGKTSAEMAKQERHDKRKAFFVHEASRQSDNRQLMSWCEAMYDSEQWDADEAREVEERGQNPVVYNTIKPTIDWIIGTERRNRVDFSVQAEDDDDESEEDAQVKTKLLKYLDDTNRAGYERSYAFEDAMKAGLGWLEVSARGDRSGTKVMVQAESWRNILWDSRARKDLTDARYLFRIKAVDLDVALAYFPDKEVELKSVAQSGDSENPFQSWLGSTDLLTGLDDFNTVRGRNDWMTSGEMDVFNPRERVLLLECWTREPVRRKPSTDGLGDPIEFRVHVSIMTGQDTLVESQSPYNHDQFPFIPVWAYRNRRTGLPYSPILPLIGPQTALNHRMAKSLFEASANQIEIEKGAIAAEVMDLDELRQEMNSPDGIAVYADGALSGNRVRDRKNEGKAQAHLMLAERDISHIRQMSNVNEENLGLRGQATSRVAMDAKAERGSTGTTELFDNLSLARQIEGELTLSTAEQFMVQPMTIRVGGDNGKYSRVKINQPQADGSYLNDISARRAHFVIGEQPWKQSYAESAFASLMDVMTQLAAAAPQVVINLLDVVFDMHPHLPRKKDVLDRIRQVNGQSEPGAKMTPEQEAEKQQKAAVAQAQFEAQMAQIQADIKKAQATGEKLDAEAMNTRLQALRASAEAAAILAAAPALTPIADELLKSAGFQDRNAPQVIDAQAPMQSMQTAQPVQPTAPMAQGVM